MDNEISFTALRLVVSKDLPRSDGITSFLFSPSHILTTTTTNDNPLEECKQFHTGAQSSGPKNCFCVQPGVSFSLQRAELLIENDFSQLTNYLVMIKLL